MKAGKKIKMKFVIKIELQKKVEEGGVKNHLNISLYEFNVSRALKDSLDPLLKKLGSSLQM